MQRAVLILVVGLVAACGDEGGTPERPDARVPADAGAPDATYYAQCRESCAAANDCALGTSGPLYTVEHWRCDDGTCRWGGCLADGECGAGFVCRQYDGLIPSCVEECAAPADCLGPASPLLDLDNYDCTQGGCHWLGCNNTSECEGHNGPGSVCRDTDNVPICFKACAGAADCGTPPDGWLFVCRDGVCHSTCEGTTCQTAAGCDPNGCICR